MKKVYLIAAVSFLFATVYSQGFTVKAKVINTRGFSPLIVYFVNDKPIYDSGYTINDDWYIFKGRVDAPVIASFLFPRDTVNQILVTGGMIPGPLLEFVLSNDEITINGNAASLIAASVKGGKGNDEWSQVRPKLAKLENEKWLMLKDAFRKYNSDTAVQKKEETIDSLSNVLRMDFIKKNPQSFVAAYYLSGLSGMMNLDEITALYNPFTADNRNNKYAKDIAKKIEGLEASAIGKQAIPLNKKDMSGNPVNLETLKGKYVLLDFWGSWCGPCRKTHPHLKTLYAKYKDVGFEMVGIASESGDLNRATQSWKKAVAEDGLPWIQVLNNNGKETFDAVTAYGISAFPTKILLNKDGIIIGRYVGDGDEIDGKLQEIFGK
jgi:thiol-disulfide isomerase/thioredoxin